MVCSPNMLNTIRTVSFSATMENPFYVGAEVIHDLGTSWRSHQSMVHGHRHDPTDWGAIEMTTKELIQKLQELVREGDCDIDIVVAWGNVTCSYPITVVERNNDGAVDFIGIYCDD